MRFRFLSAILVASTLLLVAPGAASAKGALGVDLNLSDRFGDGAGALNVGYGFNIRAGLNVPLPVLLLELGAMFRFNHWGLSAGLDGRQRTYDLLAGGRLGAGAFIKPWAAFYIGYGHLSSELVQAGATLSEGHSGTGFLFGGGVDLAFSFLSLGIHLDYNKDAVDGAFGRPDSAQWITFGGNVTVLF